MQVILAKSAGFCFGVDRALKKVYDNLGEEHIYTYGEIIHNEVVVEELEAQGVKVVHQLDQLEALPKGKLVVRSHGITKAQEDQIKKSGFDMIEATCPYVKKIHKLVARASEKGHRIIIIGNAKHPEVIGIAGWADEPVLILDTPESVVSTRFEMDLTYEVVAQTTYNHQVFEDMVNALHNQGIHVIINETICKATMDRQSEAIEIATQVDVMIVIGSRSSSNTKKLYEICKRQCDATYHIESIEEFELEILRGKTSVGITAGASTPKKLIEEVISNVRNAK